jgi:hypothetical protein
VGIEEVDLVVVKVVSEEIGEITRVEEEMIVRITSRTRHFKEEDTEEAIGEDIEEDTIRNKMMETEGTIIIAGAEVRIIIIREALVIKMNIEEVEAVRIIKIVNMKIITIRKGRKNTLTL